LRDTVAAIRNTFNLKDELYIQSQSKRLYYNLQCSFTASAYQDAVQQLLLQ